MNAAFLWKRSLGNPAAIPAKSRLEVPFQMQGRRLAKPQDLNGVKVRSRGLSKRAPPPVHPADRTRPGMGRRAYRRIYKSSAIMTNKSRRGVKFKR